MRKNYRLIQLSIWSTYAVCCLVSALKVGGVPTWAHALIPAGFLIGEQIIDLIEHRKS